MEILARYKLMDETLPLDTGIYAIHNKLNGKLYIGSASAINPSKPWTRGFRARFGRHRWEIDHDCHHAEKFRRAIAKYKRQGVELNSVFEILILELVPPEECEDVEQMYLDAYQHFYNSAHFVKGHRRGVEVSQETRHKQRLKKLGTKASEETRRKKSEAMKLRDCTHNAKKHLGISPCGKRVIFKNAADFGRRFGLLHGNISLCVIGISTTYKGWQFSLYDGDEELTDLDSFSFMTEEEVLESIRNTRTYIPLQRDSDKYVLSLYKPGVGTIYPTTLADYAKAHTLVLSDLHNLLDGRLYKSQGHYKSEEYYLDKKLWLADHPVPKSTCKGVHWERKSNKWRAEYYDVKTRKTIYLGKHIHEEDAIATIKAFELTLES